MARFPPPTRRFPQVYLDGLGDREALRLKEGVGPLGGEAWLVLVTKDLVGQRELDLGVLELPDCLWRHAAMISSTFILWIQWVRHSAGAPCLHSTGRRCQQRSGPSSPSVCGGCHCGSHSQKPKFFTWRGCFSNACHHKTISPEDSFIFFSWDTKYQKLHLATTWLGAKMPCGRGAVLALGGGQAAPQPLALSQHARGLRSVLSTLAATHKKISFILWLNIPLRVHTTFSSFIYRWISRVVPYLSYYELCCGGHVGADNFSG